MAQAETPDEALTRHSAISLARGIRNREFSATDVVDAHIARIETVNPKLNAVVIPLFDEARGQAAVADETLANGAEVGPLHGVPVTIKEQYRVAGTQTTLGASEKIGNVARTEGPLVTALRNAGAILLGKTNIIQTLAGWEADNPVYGRTNNPFDLDRSPGGSSGGEGAIIAAGGSPLGLGGDFGGSIRVPAHFCGIHGFKPTSGRLTNDDFAPGLLTSGMEAIIPQPGPMARTVADLILAMALFAESSMRPTLDVVAPVPWKDPGRVEVPRLRIGMYTDNGYFAPSPAVARAVEDAAAALRIRGALVESINPPDVEEGVRLMVRANAAGGSRDLFKLLGDEDPIPQIAGLMRGVRIPTALRPAVAKVMEARGQDYLGGLIRHLRRSSAADYMEIVEARNSYRATFIDNLNRADLDAIICPPVAVPAFTHGASEHLLPAVSYSFVYNVLGVPAGVVAATTVRVGEEGDRDVGDDLTDIAARKVDTGSAGLPVGVQVVARHWDDDIVLAVMAAIEATLSAAPDYPRRDQLVV